MVPISLGENCGPAVKIRSAGRRQLGAFPFDNVVAPLDAVIRLLTSDFEDMLWRRNLSVGKWEGIDSVHDAAVDVFFHHSFHARGEERLDTAGRRVICDRDIGLYLPDVRRQYQHLTGKFRRVVRSDERKLLLFRRVSGSPLSGEETIRLIDALDQYGARNYRLLVICSNGEPQPLHRRITENGERWGTDAEWSRVMAED